jgi:NADH dehydrogenase FAD-containing subunit
MADRFDFLIIGLGFGGVEVAERLRRQDSSATIAIVAPKTSLLYRPWLIYLPAQRITIEQARLDLQPWAARHRVTLIEDCAEMLEPNAHQVRLQGGTTLTYVAAAVATGAVSDPQRIEGGLQHASWPCDLEDALRFARQFSSLTAGVVTVIAGGERPGPGLEYAGWLARALEAKAGSSVRLRLIDHDAALHERFGHRAMKAIRHFFERRGHEVIDGEVTAIDPDGVEMAGGRQHASALTAVVGPLSGNTPFLPSELVDGGGFVVVDDALRATGHPDLYGVGDVLSDVGALPKSWVMARLQARTVAANMLATRDGKPAAAFDVKRARRLAISMPDIGGWTVVVRNRRLLMRGRLQLALRSWMDRQYIRRHSG